MISHDDLRVTVSVIRKLTKDDFLRLVLANVNAVFDDLRRAEEDVTYYRQQAQQVIEVNTQHNDNHRVDSLHHLVGQHEKTIEELKAIVRDCVPHDSYTTIERDYINNKQKIKAIKVHRLRTGLGLKESKTHIDKLWNQTWVRNANSYDWEPNPVNIT